MLRCLLASVLISLWYDVGVGSVMLNSSEWYSSAHKLYEIHYH